MTLSSQAKASYRREEKRLLQQLAARAESLAQSGLDHGELYIGRILLGQSIHDLSELARVRLREDKAT